VKTVKACVVLHNYITQSNNVKSYVPSSFQRQENDEGKVEESDFNQNSDIHSIYSLSRLTGNRGGTKSARDQRLQLAKELLADNLAPWQFQRALRSQ